MFKNKTLSVLFGLFFSFPVFAGALDDTSVKLSPFYVGAYGGYGTVSGGYRNDGDTAMGRLVLGMQVKEYNRLMFSGEIGIQSGNNMRLEASTAAVEPTMGIPPQATLKPIVDLLITAKGRLMPDRNLYLILKAGIAYRQLQLQDRTANTDSLQRIAPELQAGFGMNITQHTMLTIFYQGIYSSSTAGVYLDSAGNTSISHIPTQQAGFLGVEYSL